LLRHPPSSTASPGAMKQWRDDVDRLLSMAHSTSTRSKTRSSRRQHEASASVRSPTVRGAQTNDLWAELNRRRAGEDARVSLERARERRQNIDSCDLDQDFAAVVPQTPMGTRFQTGVPLAGVGCAALADHLRAASWPPKFWPHLPEKYNGTTNLSEFLQVYVTAIMAAGGNTAVMATYFHVALSGPARTWLMNLTPGSVYSWEELCVRFVANFASAYQQHGVEAHLHAVRQEPVETLRKFISRFTKVRGMIPCISDASIITAFRQGVRDEKMLEKLATHDMETVPTLFALADKCARAAEGRAWHSAPQTGAAQSGGSGAVLRDGKKKKKKDCDYQKSWSTALVVAAATRGQGDRNKRLRPQKGSSGSCPVHRHGRHSLAECREIIDLAKRVSKRREQSSKDGSPPRRRPNKEKVDDGEVAAAERDLGYQSLEGDLKDIFAGGSYSGEDNKMDPRGTPCSPVYGAEARLPPEALPDPPRVRVTNGYMQKWPQPETRAPVSNAGRNPGSGPSPTASTIPRGAPQLSPSWEGPFEVTGVHRPRGNHLATTGEAPYPDAQHLCKLYP
jgi:hypothetical protein